MPRRSLSPLARSFLFALLAGAAAALVACGGTTVSSRVIGGDDAGGGTGSSGGGTGSSGGGTGSSGGGTGSSGGGEVDSGAPSMGDDAGPTTPPNKVDLLFLIDNSASMADKQDYLASAIPDLVQAFVAPTAFPAVTDMHIGIVSSSLGTRLGDQYGNGGVCLPTATFSFGGTTLPSHNDDQGHLLTRSSTLGANPPTETPLPDAPTGFLAWFPNVPANAGHTVTKGAVPISISAALVEDFVDLVAGVHDFGCGIESQLESWYRFLIQPDPYASLAVANGQASWVGVDTTVLQERHDFLRPDSVVVVVDLTDENDSEIDVRSLGGQAYAFMSYAFDPPHGTSACSTTPDDPSCTSCALLPDAGVGADPACADGGYASVYDWGYDMNLRHVHMRAKYGVDPQFPLTRYVNGLTSTKVPDRTGEYPPGAPSYTGTNDCTNPLFASSLPDPSVAGTLSSGIATSETASDVATLCNLPAGNARPSGYVFFALIGGVPWQLLHFDPTSAANSALSAGDWVRIVGTNPDVYDYSGIDPHMVESETPRSSFPFPTASLLPAVAGADGTSAAETPPQPASGPNADPYNGREWTTNVGNHVDLNVDREYACIFPLQAPRDCSNDAGAWTVPENEFLCDCSSTGLTTDELSPVCDPTTPTNQLYAKAYPTIRELELAQKLGNQGIVSSICPIDVTDNATGNDPLFGYRPAVEQIVRHVAPLL